MSRSAWFYYWSVCLAAAVLAASVFTYPERLSHRWQDFLSLTVLAIISQLYKSVTPPSRRQSYSAIVAFLFAGVLLLHPLLFVLLVVVSHVAEWLAERLTRSGNLPHWYIQPFNIATHIIAGIVAQRIYHGIHNGGTVFFVPSALLAVGTAALAYVLINHYLVGQMLVLARKVSWHESGVLNHENILTDTALVCIGYGLAMLWEVNPWLTLPALVPLVLIYRALQVPQLRRDASTDTKTGLWNAGHFMKLMVPEMQRAKRFERPLSVLMADLDLLRNINNTYGHLAGDIVLAGIGRIIRETVREYDVAGRFGGEEFAIMLPETGAAEAYVIAERLRQAVESAEFEVKTAAKPIKATVSLGVASLPSDATTHNELIHEADVAVYQAKLRGRNCVVAASEVPHSVKLETEALSDRLAAAA